MGIPHRIQYSIETGKLSLDFCNKIMGWVSFSLDREEKAWYIWYNVHVHGEKSEV